MTFVPDLTAINNALNGDLGITDSIFKSIIDCASSSITNASVKIQFLTASVIPDGIGLKALEKTIISSLMESFGPLVDMAKALLALFASTEMLVAQTLGGANPAYDPTSFTFGLNAQNASLPKIAQPSTILLAVYDSNGNAVDPTQAEIGTNYWNGTPFVLVSSLAQLTAIRNSELDTQLQGLSQTDAQDMRNNINANLQSEWNGMEQTKQINNDTPVVIRYWYYKNTINYKGNSIVINVETDYTINTTSTGFAKEKRYIVVAKLNIPSPSAPSGPRTFLPNPIMAPILFVEKVLVTILSDIIPAIVLITKTIENPTGVLGEIALVKLQQYFTALTNPITAKPFYGQSTIDIAGATLGFKLDATGLSIVTKADLSQPTVPIFDTILNFIKLPFNLLTGILKKILDFIKQLATVVTIPQDIADFLSFKFLIDLLKPDSLFSFLGGQAGQPLSMPFFSIPDISLPNVSAMESGFLMFLQGFLNAFIQMPQSIFGLNLGLKLSLTPPFKCPS